MRLRRICSLLAACLLLACCEVLYVPPVSAAASLVESATGSTGGVGGTSAVATLTTTATAGDLLVVVCSAAASTTFTLTETGFTAAKNEASSASQAIFYKVAAGTETTATCNTTVTAPLTVQVYEYGGIENVSPLDTVNATTTTGTGTSTSSGSATTLNGNDLLFAAVSTTNTSSAVTFTAPWSSSFTQENSATDSVTVGHGKNATYTYLGAAAADFSVSAASSYATGVTATSGSWIGQMVAFKIAPTPVFTGDIVDGTGASVASPSVVMSAATAGFACQTVTGTLGTSVQKIRVTNTTPTDNLGWTLAMAASSANWSDGAGHSYAYNNSAGTPAGCTSGQLTVVPTGETITPESSPEYGCTTTGLSPLAASTAFSGTTPITIVSAGSTASYYCYWDITGVGLSQTIPALQPSGTYNLNLTLTLTAL